MLYKACSNVQLCKMFGVVSFSTLIRMQRLRFLQNMLKKPGLHQLYLASLYGRYVLEEKPPSDNPWMLQYQNDIKCLEHFDDIHWVFEGVIDNPLFLIENDDAREDFVRFDCKQLKSYETWKMLNDPMYDPDADDFGHKQNHT